MRHVANQPEVQAISFLLAGMDYLESAKRIQLLLDNQQLKLRFGGSVVETLLGHAAELIFKSHFRAAHESTNALKARGHELSSMLDDILQSQNGADIVLPALNFCRTIKSDVTEQQALGEIRHHISLLNSRVGVFPYPARYPTNGLFTQANFEFLIHTLAAFAESARERCMENHNLLPV